MTPPFVGRSHPLIHTDELAELLNHAAGAELWSARRVRRWLRRAGAARQRGGRVVTTRDVLRDHLPELWQALQLEGEV